MALTTKRECTVAVEHRTAAHARGVLCGGGLSVNPDTWTRDGDRVNCRRIKYLRVSTDILPRVRPLREEDKKFVRTKETH